MNTSSERRPRSGLHGYEVNTDAFLVDPDWEVFSDQHDRRFGLAISYLKSLVKGSAYDNQVMNIRVGRNGFYVQSRRFPAAFFGDTTLPGLQFVSDEEAQAAVWEAVALYRAGEAQSLTCVYSDADPPDVFFGYRLRPLERYELGRLRSALPLHLRVMVDATEIADGLGARTGVLIYQRMEGDRHLLLTAPGRRQPFLGVIDPGD